MKWLLLAVPLLGSACDGGRDPVEPYPLTVCLVGGDDLGKMGDPEVLVYAGREIKVCCGACVESFRKDPARYLRILEEARRKKPASPEAGK